MRRGFRIVILSVLLAVMLCGSPAGAEVRPERAVKVFVGILPVAYFVERVGGANVEASVLVGPGQDPHTFEPTPRTASKLAEAQVLFKLGFPFEENIIKKVGSTFKNIKVVDLQQGIKLRRITEEETEAGEAEHGHGLHDEGEKDEHGHLPAVVKKHHHHHEAGEMDPHTWLDPRLVKIQARTLADTFIEIDPVRKEQFEKNLKEFQADLDAVHEQLAKALAPLKGKSFFVFHPAYAYFGEAYGLKQVAVQLEGREPSARQLARLIDLAKKNEVKVIFIQPQFSKKGAESLAKAIGATVVTLDDLAPDYLKNLKEMAAKLDSALRVQQK